MGIKKITILFLILSLIGLGVSYSIFQLDLQASATGDLLLKLRESFFYGMSALTLIFLILLFIPRAFPTWKKFAVWFIPLATLLFIFYPDPGSGDYFSPYPEQVYKWVSILYVVISIGIITFSASKPNATSSTLPN
ncbi:hypothetical protein A3G53_00595 [Candidatus Nomurabacteria bacterium RIFCSPLOWO2_12_FULL_44_11]|uniref:Uncharacterized protein n=1 Tax=Candidatus Nomurabacteria bacterium RIFCSPLOWO2_12_FULL_44_11 TaxID=1801796 RepID=A0A1F6Y4L8_9BACT|nr:MAG: hypothetical protein A3G53_00595 [Candidatus Nomurabacteria bacterium RIFCSPLOWO2_12_FULL_44_11]